VCTVCTQLNAIIIQFCNGMLVAKGDTKNSRSYFVLQFILNSGPRLWEDRNVKDLMLYICGCRYVDIQNLLNNSVMSYLVFCYICLIMIMYLPELQKVIKRS
jgi:hypothetical protein